MDDIDFLFSHSLMPKKNTLNASERLLHILMHVAASPQPLIAQQISDETGIPLSSLYRYLAILKEWQLLEEDPISKRFFGGAASMQLSRHFLRFSALPDQLRPLLKALQRDTGEMAAFMVAVGYQALCVESVDSPYALRCAYEKGQSQPLILGASSKVLLAHASAERQAAIFAHFGIDDEVRLSKWRQDLTGIVQQGFAISQAEFDSGVFGVSAPVFRGKKLLGAVSVMAPLDRIESRKDRLIDSVLRCAKAISKLENNLTLLGSEH